MPVNASSTALPVTSDDVRGFLRDVAGQVPGTGVTNILFDLPEFSDADIARAIRFSVARFNVMAPPSNDTEDSINIWLLLIAVSEFLMRSEAFRQTRNQITYPDGERPIGLDDKQQQYLALADTMRQEFEEKARNFKISRNLEACYGSLGSGYRSVSRFSYSS